MKTALILPGGGTMGAIEFGACKVIFEKMTPDVIIGTSVGALNGAFAAQGNFRKKIPEIEEMWKAVKRSHIMPLNKELFYKAYHASSLYSNKGLYRLLDKHLVSRTFEALTIPLYVNCTNLLNGESEFFSHGELARPLVASCSCAPFLPPVMIEGKPYVDGALGSVFGIQKAIELQCKKVIIIGIGHFIHYNLSLKSFREHAEYSVALMRNQNMRHEIELCCDHGIEVVEIRPPTPTVEIFPTHSSDMATLIKMGEEEARRMLG
jgi:NTE family protein